MVQPPESFGSLLQHFTGSKSHNIKLRELALKKGLSLSECGIKRQMANGKWQMAKFDTEEKFYKALGMQWIPPELRDDVGVAGGRGGLDWGGCGGGALVVSFGFGVESIFCTLDYFVSGISFLV